MFGWIETLKNLILNKYLGSFVRTILAALVGVLAASGLPGAVDLSEIVKTNLPELATAITTVLAYILVQGWAWMQESKAVQIPKDSFVISKANYSRLTEQYRHSDGGADG